MFVLRSLIVAVVQASDRRVSNNATLSCGTHPATRCLLSQALVSAVVVVVANVVSKESLQMAFIESDDVVEPIAAAASHPALGNRVLPGTLDRGLHASNLPSAKGSGNLQSILLIVVEEQEPGRGLVGKCFAQLLDDPTAGRIRGDVEVQDATTVMANDEKAVEQVESDDGAVKKSMAAIASR
jgi:hypothetical protein